MPNQKENTNTKAKEMIASVLKNVPPESRAAAAKNLPYIVSALSDEGILDPNVLAYALATTQAETGSFNPVREGYFVDDKYGYDPGFTGRSEARKRDYSGGEDYFGRGFIQLTHDFNYKQLGERIGMGDQLLKNPDLALEPRTAARILAAFFKDRGVADLAKQGNFYAARSPVNGTDRAEEIAKMARTYRDTMPYPTQKVTDPNFTYKGALDKSSFFDKVRNAVDISARAEEPQGGYLQTLRTQALMTPRTQTTKPNQNTYTVQPGDTLWGIAQRTLGDGQKWRELGGYTGSPRLLPIGTNLSIPRAAATPTTPRAPMTPRTQAPMTPRVSAPMTPRTATPSPITSRVQTAKPVSTPTPQRTAIAAPKMSYQAPMTRIPAPTTNYFSSIYNALKKIF